ncbi:MAG: hypothetical protein IKO72_04585 [Kiritimatiellae bacterium]|nr:hypothetical protein [Kiritimatiellia bacterium]
MRSAKTILAAAACAIAFSGLDAGQLYRAALVDSFDFARYFDCETKKGTVQIIDHVLSHGGNAVWWRANGGAVQRYPSRLEDGPMLENPFDKRRLPDEREYYGWLRLDRGETNLIAYALGCCRARGIPNGIHVSYEENHWSATMIGGWNLRHPQYWVRTKNGPPWPGRASMAFPEVFERKVQMMGELLDMEPEWLYIDMWRAGRWSLVYEYVEPMVKAWREKYACEPPDDPEDPRWIELFEPIQTAYFRAIKREIAKRGGKTKLCAGLPHMNAEEDVNYKTLALNWRKLAAEGTLDGIAVTSIRLPPKAKGEALWGVIRDAYMYAKKNSGKAETFFHCSMYDYQKGIPTYKDRTGLSAGECAKRLLDLAEECGGKGVVLECVDYPNYPADVVGELNKR